MGIFKENIMKDNVALITGGSTGMGKEITRTLADRLASGQGL